MDAKTRPRVLPDPRDREIIQAPLPPWEPGSMELSGAHSPMDLLRGMQAGVEGLNAQPAAIGVGDGFSKNDWNAEEDLRSGEADVNAREKAVAEVSRDWEEGGDIRDAARTVWAQEQTGPDANWDDEGWAGVEQDEEGSSSGYGAGSGRMGTLTHGEEGEGLELENWGESKAAAEEDARAKPERPWMRGLQDEGGVLRSPTMLDILEGNLPRGREGSDEERSSEERMEGDDGSRNEVELPPNIDEIMAEMRSLVQQDLDGRRQRHKHLSDAGEEEEEEENREEQSSEEDGWFEDDSDEELLEEDGEEEEDGFGREMVAESAGVDADSQARVELKRLMAEFSGSGRSLAEGYDTKRGLDANADDPSVGMTAEELAPWHRESDSQEVIDDREESRDWTPLMHESVHKRTVALLGVVRLLEADAMEAARRADEEMGFPREDGRAGPAVHATMRARLRCLTESRRCKKAIQFVEREYPEEVGWAYYYYY